MPEEPASTSPPARTRTRVTRRFLSAGTALALVLAPFVATVEARSAAAAPRIYHVDCSAKKAGDGSTKAPWRSLAAVKAHGEMLPGEKILLRRGSTCRGQLIARGSGTKSAPVLVGAYGKGAKPKIIGGGTPNETGTVELRDVSHWTVQDLAITNWTGGRNPSTYRSGILVWNSGVGRLAGITIQRNSISSVSSNPAGKGRSRDFGGVSVLTAGSHGDGFDGVNISHNTVTGVGRTGIMVSNREYPGGSDTKVLISRNRVKNSRGDGIVLLGSIKGRLAYNVVAGAANFWPCPQCKGISPATANAAIWTAQSKNVRIDHNEAYGTKYLGGDGEGLDIDASAIDTVVEYNYSHDNEGGGILLCGSSNAVVRFNIFENNAKSAFAFIGNMPAKNTQMYNNTVYISSKVRARPVRFFNGTQKTKTIFKNNLVYNYSLRDWAWPAKPTTSANTLVGVLGTGRPNDAKTSLRDPGLKNPGSGGNGRSTLGGYKPKKASTFKKGVAIPKSVTRDFFGKKINPAKPPRGAAG